MLFRSELKMALLNELMQVFKFLKEASYALHKRYEHRTYNQKAIEQFNLFRLPLELLWLRILYIFIKLETTSDSDLREFTRILAMERITLLYQKQIPRL